MVFSIFISWILYIELKNLTNILYNNYFCFSPDSAINFNKSYNLMI